MTRPLLQQAEKRRRSAGNWRGWAVFLPPPQPTPHTPSHPTHPHAVNATDYRLPTWLDYVDGCACCLSHTHGVSHCFVSARGCVSFDAISECCADLAPGKNRVCPDPSLYGTVADAVHRRLLEAAAATTGEPVKHECVGRAEAGVGGCPPGKRPAISLNALHEVHVLLFVLASLHILAGALLIALTSLRVRAWHQWERTAPAPSAVVAADAKQPADAPPARTVELTTVREKDDEEAAPTPTAAPTAATPPPVALSPWRQRPETLTGVWPRTREAIVCLGRQLLPQGTCCVGGRVGPGSWAGAAGVMMVD